MMFTPQYSSANTRDVIRKVKGAFLPLRCAVEVELHDRQRPGSRTAATLRLSIMNPGRAVLRMPSITLGNLGDDYALEQALSQAIMTARAALPQQTA